MCQNRFLQPVKLSGCKDAAPVRDKKVKYSALRQFSKPQGGAAHADGTNTIFTYVFGTGSTKAGLPGGSFYAPVVHLHTVCTGQTVGWCKTSGVPCCTSISHIILLLVNKLSIIVANR
jgi:hypothetical protein